MISHKCYVLHIKVTPRACLTYEGYRLGAIFTYQPPTCAVFTCHVPCDHISDYPQVQCLQPTSTVITYCFPQLHYLHIKVPFKTRSCLSTRLGRWVCCLSSKLGLLSVYNTGSVVGLQDWVCCLCTTLDLLSVYNTWSVSCLQNWVCCPSKTLGLLSGVLSRQ